MFLRQTCWSSATPQPSTLLFPDRMRVAEAAKLCFYTQKPPVNCEQRPAANLHISLTFRKLLILIIFAILIGKMSWMCIFVKRIRAWIVGLKRGSRNVEHYCSHPAGGCLMKKSLSYTCNWATTQKQKQETDPMSKFKCTIVSLLLAVFSAQRRFLRLRALVCSRAATEAALIGPRAHSARLPMLTQPWIIHLSHTSHSCLHHHVWRNVNDKEET